MEHKLNHINAQGEAVMVDISHKGITQRTAIACGSIRMNAAAFEAIKSGQNKKGDALATARIAGIMAAKQTPQMIPLCHTLLLESVSVDFWADESAYTITATCTARCTGKTGAEMEALCGASTALLTLYDMCKALDKGMCITDIHLKQKTGGKSDYTLAEEDARHV